MKNARHLLIAIVVSIGLLGAVSALADVPPAPTAYTNTVAAKPDAEGFTPVKESELAASEQLPANKLVAGAYGFILACLIVWIASVAVRAKKVEEELVALRAKIGKAG